MLFRYRKIIQIKLYDWLCMNNVSKTHYMFFHKARIKVTKLHFKGNVSIHNDLIEQVYHTKFLGVIIDSKVNWSEHVKHIVTKVSNKAKQYMNIKGLIKLYKFLVYP